VLQIHTAAAVVGVDQVSGWGVQVEVVRMEDRVARHGMKHVAKMGFLILEEEEALDIHKGQQTVAWVVKLVRVVAYLRVLMDRDITGRMQLVEQLDLRYKDLLGI
jgi:hypothetical protein